MVELCLMASHGYPPGLGVGFHQEHVPSREFNHFRPCHGLKQDLVDPLSCNLSVQQKECRSLGAFLDSNNFFRFDTTCRRPAVIGFQDTSPDSAVFGSGIVERIARHEKILKLLISGSIEEDDPLLNLSMLHDLTRPQSSIPDSPQQPFVSHFRQSSSRDGETMQNLVYPVRELYLREPFLDLEADRSSCPEKAYHLNAQLPCSYTTNEMVDMLSVLSDIHSLKNTNKSSRQTMLVPYFESRRKASARADASKLATEKVGSLKMQEKVKDKTPRKKKTMSNRSGSERDAYCNSYLHACESLLSVIMDRKQQGQNAFLSLKKSSPRLPRLLTQFAASIAGTGIAVVLSVLCRVASNRVPFCASKLLSTGLGLGLICLSWAVNRLRDTVVSITKTPAKTNLQEQEMMNHLDRNLKDIYFSAAALIAVVVLKAA